MHIALVLWNPTMQNNITHNLTRGFLSPRDPWGGPVGRGPGGPASWQLDPSWFLKLGKKTPRNPARLEFFSRPFQAKPQKLLRNATFLCKFFAPFFGLARLCLICLCFISLNSGGGSAREKKNASWSPPQRGGPLWHKQTLNLTGL